MGGGGRAPCGGGGVEDGFGAVKVSRLRPVPTRRFYPSLPTNGADCGGGNDRATGMILPFMSGSRPVARMRLWCISCTVTGRGDGLVLGDFSLFV